MFKAAGLSAYMEEQLLHSIKKVGEITLVFHFLPLLPLSSSLNCNPLRLAAPNLINTPTK